MKKNGTPRIISMKVYPVAGHDSMLLTLSGAHEPFFTRNIVVLEDELGNLGIGEVHGGEYITTALESYSINVIGQEIGNYKRVVNTIKQMQINTTRINGEGLQKLDLSNLKFVVHAETAIEAAMLDLLGKYMNLPVCALLGDGQQREEIEVLGYLFYIHDKDSVDLPYLDESNSDDKWFSIRRKKALTAESILNQAKEAQKKYGFKNFKLKGGVFSGDKEMEAVTLLKKSMPYARINIDPNGAWTLGEAVDLCKNKHNILSYVEDPCGPENGFSSREIMCEFKNATQLQVATNMIATDWRQFYHAISLKSVDIILADPHFWTMNGSVRIAQILNDWGLTWGSHSNNHFDISLSIFAHCAAAAPGNITPIDTHWIWQDGQELCDNTLKIKDGKLKIPNKPGLGIDINFDKLMKANELYKSIKDHDRDDSKPMQFVIPGWEFDSKKPTLVR